MPTPTPSPAPSPAFSFKDIPRSLWMFLAEDRWRYLGHLSIFLLGQTYELVPPLLIGLMLEFLMRYSVGESLLPLAWIIGGLAVSNAVNALLRLRSRRKLGQIAVSCQYRAKLWGFEKLLDFSLSWHQKESTGNKAQRILTGAAAVRDWANFHNDLVPPLVAFLGTIVACVFLHWASVFFFVLYVLGLMLIENHFDRKIARLSQTINISAENASGTLIENAANILTVKALGTARHATQQVQSREALTRDLGHERVRLFTTKWMAFQVHNSVAWGLFLVGIAAAVLHHKLGLGLVLTYTQYFNSLRQSAQNFTDRFQTMTERYADLARIMPLFAETPSATKKCEFPDSWHQIAMHDIQFGYSGEEHTAVLNGVSLNIPRGAKLGVAGRSGCGKSTLVKLLLGLYLPQQGHIQIDDVLLTDIDHEARARQISVVLQETELFALSLKNNITMMREMDEVLFRQACYVACLDELIARLPQGIDTQIGERGYALSGGERQRIGMARAIYRQPQILLLDEATSALDALTESMVMQRLLQGSSDEMTLVVVAHRLSTLMPLQQIIVLEQGRVVECGTFEELSAQTDRHFVSQSFLV